MQNSKPAQDPCCVKALSAVASAGPGLGFVFPMAPEPDCGSAEKPFPGLAGKPGYDLCSFVEAFVDTAAGSIPRIKTRLERSDRLGTVLARLGVNRAHYRVAPGLYCVGEPDAEAPVLVTANYKLTFDALRTELSGLHLWLLVLETRGVNVWCSAGKGTLDAAEIIRRIRLTGLDQVVSHREIIVPQLAANGVCARSVKEGSGFRVIWGPVRARDLKPFLRAGKQADPAMRLVTFNLTERVVLIPVEVYLLKKPSLWILASLFILSGIGTSVFSFTAALSRGWIAVAAYFWAVIAGAVAVPILLPWLPGRAFAVKGAITGAVAGFGTTLLFRGQVGFTEGLALCLWTLAVSSYLATNFTGATPFTSPSGVETEMRRALPLQAGAAVLAAFAWVGSVFFH